MCGMNLAFDRELIGPAMYFGLMGDGQPLGRYDDMWAGWCTKVSLILPAASVISQLTVHGYMHRTTIAKSWSQGLNRQARPIT